MRRRSSDGGARMEAIEHVYRARHRDFVRMAQAVVGDAELAKDVVHDAFVSAVRSRSTFRGEGSLDGWIWRAVLNEARDQSRRRPVVPLDEKLPASYQPAAGPDRRWVRSAVAELPERQRLVLFLRYFGDLDYQTIADALAIQPGTVAATLNAARETLRRRLTPPTETEEDDEGYRHAL